MTTIPRHSLVSFADYKQKSSVVNGKMKSGMPDQVVLTLERPEARRKMTLWRFRIKLTRLDTHDNWQLGLIQWIAS